MGYHTALSEHGGTHTNKYRKLLVSIYAKQTTEQIGYISPFAY